MIKILIADDHKIIRDGLRSLLEKESGMQVIAEAQTGRDAVRLAQKLLPDVIIMDINMPDLNGMDATRQILGEQDKIKVIALSMHSDRRYVMGMLKAGVCGYMLKDCAFEELAQAIKAVVNKKTYLSPSIAGTVLKDYLHHLSFDEDAEATILTAREREVLQLIAEGLSTRQASERLHVSVKTVETHRRKIMMKLGIHSTAELTKYALREGLTSLDT